MENNFSFTFCVNVGFQRTILCYSIERERLRERERAVRAMISVQAEQVAGGPDTRTALPSNHAPPNLFRAPVRVSTFSIRSSYSKCLYVTKKSILSRDGVIDRLLYLKYLLNIELKRNEYLYFNNSTIFNRMKLCS